jgi:hypothetical protein
LLALFNTFFAFTPEKNKILFSAISTIRFAFMKKIMKKINVLIYASILNISINIYSMEERHINLDDEYSIIHALQDNNLTEITPELCSNPHTLDLITRPYGPLPTVLQACQNDEAVIKFCNTIKEVDRAQNASQQNNLMYLSNIILDYCSPKRICAYLQAQCLYQPNHEITAQEKEILVFQTALAKKIAILYTRMPPAIKRPALYYEKAQRALLAIRMYSNDPDTMVDIINMHNVTLNQPDDYKLSCDIHEYALTYQNRGHAPLLQALIKHKAVKPDPDFLTHLVLKFLTDSWCKHSSASFKWCVQNGAKINGPFPQNPRHRPQHSWADDPPKTVLDAVISNSLNEGDEIKTLKQYGLSLSTEEWNAKLKEMPVPKKSWKNEGNLYSIFQWKTWKILDANPELPIDQEIANMIHDTLEIKIKSENHPYIHPDAIQQIEERIWRHTTGLRYLTKKAGAATQQTFRGALYTVTHMRSKEKTKDE